MRVPVWIVALVGVVIVVGAGLVFLPRPVPTDVQTPEVAKAPSQGGRQFVLAVSWQPGFCETRPDKPECQSQSEERFDATHFALHGLWLTGQNDEYCGITAEIERRDRQGHWEDLPALKLSAETLGALGRVMPGVQSGLERHEWVKHGACAAADPETYYGHSLGLMETLNQSGVATLFAANIGQRLDLAEIRAAFDKAFGSGAGGRVGLVCDNDHGRRLIVELRIALGGDVGDNMPDLGQQMLAAAPAFGGCTGGIIDRVGFD